jgi:branched-chain amino acid transport system substrate-binding protein
VDRMIQRDRVDFMTGVVFSAVLLPILHSILDSKTFYLSPNTGPRDYAGSKCHPYFFAVAWQNEDLSTAMGRFMTEEGFKNVYAIAPNYPGGHETLHGFKRSYKGNYQEFYTKLGQLDYGAELSTIRAAKPDAVFMFLPGGMGINFIKQFVAGGLSRDIKLFVPGFSADEDTIKPLQEVLLGAFNASQWAHDLPNEANRKFVAAFEREYQRLPSMFAAQAWDTIALIDAAVRDTKGRIEDKDAVRNALRAARFESVRGTFKFNRNHYPIHDIHMRVVERDAKGRITNRTVGKIMEAYADPYAHECKMPD